MHGRGRLTIDRRIPTYNAGTGAGAGDGNEEVRGTGSGLFFGFCWTGRWLVLSDKQAVIAAGGGQ